VLVLIFCAYLRLNFIVRHGGPGPLADSARELAGDRLFRVLTRVLVLARISIAKPGSRNLRVLSSRDPFVEGVSGG